MAKRGFLWLLLLFAALTTQAATVTVTVVDAASGRPLEGATGYASGATLIANADGIFTVPTDGAGTQVSVKMPGYAREAVTLDGQVRISANVISDFG
ncbi:hypothetical protein [Burkholderia stagnalis]|uniref:hypothetical protein n=1 Tax=Burkholderia stagnalis TaxID=1503054 RepID=UPI000ADCC132|nr:hypothetical protein [Burkholderia stagnalis]